jgi:hypothetical protein
VFHTKSEIPKIKQEVMELTGVNIKDPYYDIVEDWQNGDYTLWMVGNGSGLRWWLDPETLRIDIDSVIEQLNGKNQYYFSLESILNEIKSKKTDLLAMDGQSFANKYNEYSASAYKIIQNSENNGGSNDQINKNYASILNLLSEINMVIITRERVKEALPILTKDIEDANNMLVLKSGEYIDYEGMASRLEYDTKEGTEAYYAKDDAALAPLFEEINKLIPKLRDAVKYASVDKENIKIQKIQDFYNQFKQAYESRSESQVMDLISDDWDAGDGTTLSDLEVNFRRIFSIFDSISCSISNIQVFPVSENMYNVSYDIVINGDNYERNLHHEEKSSVNEQVIIDKSGKVKINKTLNGRFWYIE